MVSVLLLLLRTTLQPHRRQCPSTARAAASRRRGGGWRSFAPHPLRRLFAAPTLLPLAVVLCPE